MALKRYVTVIGAGIHYDNGTEPVFYPYHSYVFMDPNDPVVVAYVAASEAYLWPVYQGDAEDVGLPMLVVDPVTVSFNADSRVGWFVTFGADAILYGFVAFGADTVLS